MIISGFKVRYLILTISSLFAIFSAFLLSESYRFDRFFAFSNSSKDPSSSGWIYNQLSSLNLSAGILGQGNNLTSVTLPEILAWMLTLNPSACCAIICPFVTVSQHEIEPDLMFW